MLAEMENQAEQWIAVATVANEQRAAELGLVLIAIGIEHQRSPGGAGWEIWVPVASAAQARSELAEYVTENKRPIGQRRVEEVGGALPGVAAYIVILLAVFVCLHQSVFYLDWFGAGRLDAGRVVAGEWWRTVTALTVHVDVDHLGGNLVFGAFFGYFVGALPRSRRRLARDPRRGNARERAERRGRSRRTHRSIGASTAVFAALGMLTAYTWRRGFLARDAVARADRADRRGHRVARVHRHRGREHGSHRASCSASSRASAVGSRSRAGRASSGSARAAGRRCARRSRLRAWWRRGLWALAAAG